MELDGKAVLSIHEPIHTVGAPIMQQILNLWLEARKKYDSGEWNEEHYEDWLIHYPRVLPYGPVEEGDLDEDRVIVQPAKKKHSRKKKNKSTMDK